MRPLLTLARPSLMLQSPGKLRPLMGTWLRLKCYLDNSSEHWVNPRSFTHKILVGTKHDLVETQPANFAANQIAVAFPLVRWSHYIVQPGFQPTM